MLFHCDAVGTRWARFEGRVEVQIEPFVLGEGIVCDFEDVDFMVALKVNDARIIFIEEIVGYHQATIVAVQHDIVRSSICAEADNGYLLRIEAVANVQHHYLPSHERAHDQPVAALRCRHDLAHSAGHRCVDMGLHSREIKYWRACTALGIDQIDVAIKHARCIPVAMRIIREHLHVHRALRRTRRLV